MYQTGGPTCFFGKITHEHIGTHVVHVEQKNMQALDVRNVANPGVVHSINHPYIISANQSRNGT